MITIYKIILAGTPAFAYPIFEKLINNNDYQIVAIITQPDKINQRNNKINFSPIKKLALKYQIKLLQPKKINNILDDLKALDYDLLLTCAYGQFLSIEVLNVAKVSSLNIHASLLPKLRGGAPIHHAVIKGYPTTGITLMHMEKKMDAGNIIFQKEIPINDEDYSWDYSWQSITISNW